MKRIVVLTLLVCPCIGMAAVEKTIEDIEMPPPVSLEEPAKKIVATDISEELIQQEVKKRFSKKEEKIKAESEIPVLTSTKADSKASSNPILRMVFSFGIIGLTAAGFFFFMKWWKKRQGIDVEKSKISILSQHHLGGKKQLAIIRVAGESILIGITEQNISMIKSLSLIDDEFPETVSANFAKSLTKTDAAGAVDEEISSDRDQVEEFAFAQIKDKVSKRIKDMRPIG